MQAVGRQNAMIGGLDEGNQILPISEKLVVERGDGITPGERPQTQTSFQHLNCLPLLSGPLRPHMADRIPFYGLHPWANPIRFDPNSADDISKRLENFVSDLRTVSGNNNLPGPVGGGMIHGYLWGDNGTRETFDSVEDMNCWLNRHLKFINKTIDLRPYPLVLYHLDLCRRNTKVMEDNPICLLDWAMRISSRHSSRLLLPHAF
ncbi:hypothetical protein AJ78_03875 [Emergomyces pasteurianus Ep9510]|uniref:Aminoglycoside phosphotransferase domain-containing protein n=1 Tax=Emergomyces pasteurianus Ep9510 TaxID=1447872 RepID=A0A1J9PHI2_9EURO|nr:hypothetical protein AJ78_03875 [Emergomyces pasteurianus Ep9510]